MTRPFDTLKALAIASLARESTSDSVQQGAEDSARQMEVVANALYLLTKVRGHKVIGAPVFEPYSSRPTTHTHAK